MCSVSVCYLKKFSPRERGCSGQRPVWAALDQVFPARAGMFRVMMSGRLTRGSFPRASGDVPQISDQLNVRREFSPRERGCSRHRASRNRQHTVFPARAGMFPIVWGEAFDSGGFPRASGDVPT